MFAILQGFQEVNKLIEGPHLCMCVQCLNRVPTEYILFYILFHYGLLQDTEYNSLCYTVGACVSCLLFFGCAGFSLCTRDLPSSLQHEGSLDATWKLLVVTCGIQLPDQGSNLHPLHWQYGVLATGAPGKSQDLVVLMSESLLWCLRLYEKSTVDEEYNGLNASQYGKHFLKLKKL